MMDFENKQDERTEQNRTEILVDIYKEVNLLQDEVKNNIGDPEKTIECKTMEEYNERKAAYLDAVFLNAIDMYEFKRTFILPILEGNLGKDSIKKCKEIYNQKKYSISIIYEYIPAGSQVFDSYVSTNLNIGSVYVTNDVVRQEVGNIYSNLVGKKSIKYKLNYFGNNKLERKYIYLLHAIDNKIFGLFDIPIRPLPPKDISLKDQKRLETELETEKNKILLDDPTKKILDTVGVKTPQPGYGEGMSVSIVPTPATKTEVVTQGIYRKGYIDGKEVPLDIYDVYIQYKKDNMIQDGTYMPKPGNSRYQNLSREYFRDNILNKDPKYTVAEKK